MDRRGFSAPSSNDNAKNALPRALKLEFSNAATSFIDYARLLGSIYSPATRNRLDPVGNVIDRDPEIFFNAVTHGRVTFLANADDASNIRAATAAYQSKVPCVEIGSTLKDLPQGFDGGKLVVAVLSLREALNHTACQVAAISSVNEFGQRSYYALGWKQVTDRRRIKNLFERTGKKPAPKAEKVWVESDIDTYAAEADFVMRAKEKGGLYNKKTRQFIAVDFSALNDVGLNEAQLTAFKNKTVLPQAAAV